MSDLLAAALDYAARGWPVLPLHTWDGTCTCRRDDCASPAKHPRTRNGLKDATVEADPIRSWWGRWPDANIGLRTGVAFDVLDIDGDPGWDSVHRMDDEHGTGTWGPTSMTGGGGAHVLYQVTGIGNRAGLLEHVDWRGRNGYIVAPPSLHATGKRYEWDDGWHTNIDLSRPDGWLHALLFPPAPQPRAAGQVPAPRAKTSNYAQRALEAEITELVRAGEGSRNDTLNAVAFSLYQLVAGGELDDSEVTSTLTRAATGVGLGAGEIEATISSARAAGSRTPRCAPTLHVVGTSALAPAVDLGPQPAHKPGTPDQPEPTGWEPVDVAAILDAGCVSQPPTTYARTDGICLFYPGRIHALNGEPESGKSWAAQHATAQAVKAGQNVLYLDFEDSPESVLGRLEALGVSRDGLVEHVTYINPSGPLELAAYAVLRAVMDRRPPALAIIDGVTEAMALLGLDLERNADSARFWRQLPRPLARHGAAVVLVDHVVKDRENRGRWAIGAQHKMAAITGAAFTVEAATPFGRNRKGIARISITKDRPGHLRQYATGTLIAELHLDSTDETVIGELRPPARGSGETMVPTYIMEKVSRTLEHGPALTLNALRAAVGGKSAYVDLAVQHLIGAGNVEVHQQGQSRYHNLLKAYRQPDTKGDGDD